MGHLNSLNLVILIGHVGFPPKLQTSRKPGKKPEPFAQFTLCTNIVYNFDNFKPRPTWHKIVAFKQQAENICEHLKKGTHVLIIGHIDKKPYKKSGVKMFNVQVILDTFTVLYGGPLENNKQPTAGPPPDKEEIIEDPF